MDLYTDLRLAWQMYWMTQPKRSMIGYELMDHENADYNIAFIWIVMAVIGPYIIQYSSTLNAYFN